MIEPIKIWRRLSNIFVRGTFQERDSDGRLTAQQYSGEVSSKMDNPQSYGFASKGIGGKTYTICNGGNRDNSVVILHELTGAPTLADNEVAVWNNQGAVITLKADGTIELQGSAFGGLIKVAELVTWLNSHTHGTSPTPTTPIVQATIENTGVNHG